VARVVDFWEVFLEGCLNEKDRADQNNMGHFDEGKSKG
jgi:hypothetical protein